MGKYLGGEVAVYIVQDERSLDWSPIRFVFSGHSRVVKTIEIGILFQYLDRRTNLGVEK